MNSRQLLNIIGDIDERHIKAAAPAEKRTKKAPVFAKWAAACVLIVGAAGIGSYSYIAEAREYNEALNFFNENEMSAEGLTRSEIKEVYRDITTNSFTYSKTAEVIKNSISSDRVSGYELSQDNPTPEELQIMWNNKIFTDSQKDGINYKLRSEYKMDETLGFEVHDKSIIEKYDGDKLLWSVPIAYIFNDYAALSDGIICYGCTESHSSFDISHACMTKLDNNGNILWSVILDNGFKLEYISKIIENSDGSLAIISRGDLNYFCLSQYTAEGKRTHFRKTEVGNYGFWNAAAFDEGYIVQLGSFNQNEHAKIVKVDYYGNITEEISYGDENYYYYITDMLQYNGDIYLSAYAVPRLENEEENAGGRNDIAAVLNYIFNNDVWDISSEELTPMVRGNFTAMLLVCEPLSGKPQEYYSAEGSLGGALAINENGNLLWETESITSTFFSPATSAFTIGGTSTIYRYEFDSSGTLINSEKTDKTVKFAR